MERPAGPGERDSDEGFGLVEVIVAMAIFAGVTVGLLGATLQAAKVTRDNRQRVVAANLAAQEMDFVRSTDVTSLPTGLTYGYYGADLAPVVGADEIGDPGVAFQVKRRSEWITSTSGESPCTATAAVGTASLAYLAVQVEVSWPKIRSVAPVRSDTVLTPTVGTFDAASGSIPVRVFFKDGAPMVNQQVQLKRVVDGADVAYRTLLTDDAGCAFFSFIPAGSYAVVVDRAGYTDRQSRQPSRTAVSVTAGSTTGAVVVEIGQSATARVRLPGSAAYPLPCGLAVMLGNTALLDDSARPGERQAGITACPTATTPPAAPSATPISIPGVFPYNDGLDVWLGRCLDADPSGSSWTAAQKLPRQELTLGAGQQTEVADLRGVSVQLDVTQVNGNNAGAARTGQPLYARHLVASDDGGCGSERNYYLGTTNSTGRIQVTLPPGTYRFRTALDGTNLTLHPSKTGSGSSTDRIVAAPSTTSVLYANVRY